MNPTTKPSHVSRAWMYAILVLAFLFVLMPFLFWQATWFGQPLSDAEIEKNLADREHPRKTQHALSQIADRIVRGDATVRRWYPQVVQLSSHKLDELRITTAWVMGQDNSSSEFHQALLRLLEDAHPMVRRNAALSLVRFKDASGRPEILAMLRAYAVRAPQFMVSAVEPSGQLAQRLKVGNTVNVGTLLARIRSNGKETEVRSQVPGTLERWLIADGAAVSAGDDILLLSPSPEMIWEALRALYLVGQPEDLPDVERYAHGSAASPEPAAAGRRELPEMIQQQATLTARAIRARAEGARL